MKLRSAIIYAVFSGMVLTALTGCKEEKTLRQIFEEHYETNVNEAMRGILAGNPEYDTLRAREISECMLEATFELDSAFVKMKGKKLQKFLMGNREKIMEKCSQPSSPQAIQRSYD